MKEDLLGLNHWLSFPATCHTVRPWSSALSSGHLRIAPPKSSSVMPKCFRYHAASAALSPVLLKKTPPTPVIFAIVTLLLKPPRFGGRVDCVTEDLRFGLWVLWESRSDFQGPVGGASVCDVHGSGSIHSPAELRAVVEEGGPGGGGKDRFALLRRRTRMPHDRRSRLPTTQRPPRCRGHAASPRRPWAAAFSCSTGLR